VVSFTLSAADAVTGGVGVGVLIGSSLSFLQAVKEEKPMTAGSSHCIIGFFMVVCEISYKLQMVIQKITPKIAWLLFLTVHECE
jgi:hypothetical protein